MQVSLIMPNYNHAGYLPASIGAMLAQTRAADEIIIVDDASTDGSLEVIERLVAGHGNVRIVRNAQRGGAVKALNSGLAIARGDLVAFLGADDQVSPDFLAVVVQLMGSYPEASFGCARVELRDQNDERTGERPIVRPRLRAGYVAPADMRRQLRYADNFFLGQVTLYRASRLRELGGFDEQLGSLSDGMLQRRLAVRWGYVFSPEILGIWRVHGANYSVTSVADAAVVERMIADSRRMLAAEAADLFPADYAATFERRLRFNSARLAVMQLAVHPGIAPDIARIVCGNRVDTTALMIAARLGPLAQLAATAWIAMRLRPFAISWLLTEAGARCAAWLRTGLTGGKAAVMTRR